MLHIPFFVIRCINLVKFVSYPVSHVNGISTCRLRAKCNLNIILINVITIIVIKGERKLKHNAKFYSILL